MKTIHIYTVNFKDSSPTSTLIQNLSERSSKEKIHLYLIDNESTERTKNELLKKLELSGLCFTLYTNSENKYYWNAVSTVIRQQKKQNLPRWTIVCNNDLIFSKNFFTKLLLPEYSHLPVIAPAILSGDTEKDLNPYLLKPLGPIEKTYYRLYYINPFTGRIVNWFGKRLNRVRRKFFTPTPSNHIFPIYAPHGSCIIFSKEFFNRDAYLDSGFQLFGEELSVAAVCQKLDLQIYYVPDLKVVHHEHSSMNRVSWDQQFFHSRRTYKLLKMKYSL